MIIDFPALLLSKGIDYADSSHHHVGHGWVGVDCPYCSPGWGKYRMGIELSTGRINCWHCGIQSPIKALKEVFKLPYRDARDLYQAHFQGYQYLAQEEEPEHELILPEGISDLLPAHRRYLENRGFDPDVLTRLWGVQGIGLASKLAWTLFIPVKDERGRTISWTTRELHDEGIRYQSAPIDHEERSLKTVLYGEHLARQKVVVVEGPTDAWAIGPGAVATLGVSYTETQLSRLARYVSRVICYDTSSEAQKRAHTICTTLKSLPGTTELVELETGDDPASADPAEIQELRQLFLS